MGRDDLAGILENVPAPLPVRIHEALQACGLSCRGMAGWKLSRRTGRFDQYMGPYLQAILPVGGSRVRQPKICWLSSHFIEQRQ